MGNLVFNPPHRRWVFVRSNFIYAFPAWRGTCTCYPNRAAPSRVPGNRRPEHLLPDIYRAQHHRAAIGHPLCNRRWQLLDPHLGKIQGHGLTQAERGRVLDDTGCSLVYLARIFRHWLDRISALFDSQRARSGNQHVDLWSQTAGSVSHPLFHQLCSSNS
jgi:hypothetical protein